MDEIEKLLAEGRIADAIDGYRKLLDAHRVVRQEYNDTQRKLNDAKFRLPALSAHVEQNNAEASAVEKLLVERITKHA